MDDIRKSIEDKYDKLRELEEYEYLLKHLNNDGRNQWWRIETPTQEVNIFTSESRKNFKEFIASEISRIKTELGLAE